MPGNTALVQWEKSLSAWFTRNCDPIQKVVDGLDIGWGGVQRWATGRMRPIEGLHLDVACGYATFLAQVGWRFLAARLVGINIDFAGPHALARPLLAQAGVAAALVQADARRLPFAGGAFSSASCFLGLQDIEIGFGTQGVREALAESIRVLQAGGVLVLFDNFPFEQFEALLDPLPVTVLDRAERALDVRWNRKVAEQATALYAAGWVAQTRSEDESAREEVRLQVHGRLVAQMESQLAAQGYYVPFGPLRMVIVRRWDTLGSQGGDAMIVRPCSRQPLLQPCSLEGHDYQLDPYIGCEHLCCYCYALKQAETDWKSEILTYRDLTSALERELLALEPQSIYMGWSSDPYQRAEETCLQTRRALELFAQRGFSVCVLTKSGLVSCDTDLLARMPGSSAGISIAFQDERVRRAFEANAPPNQQRIEALAALKAAGISTYALICPVMPFITDVATLIERVAPHADTIYIYALSMEDEGDQNWRNLRSILERNYPDLSKRYRQIAFSTEHPYWAGPRKDLEAFQANSVLNLRIEL